MGSKLISKALLSAADYQGIVDNVKKALALIQEVRGTHGTA
jgi:hypothetical protein